jgi:FixJ family two-component response regulator
MGVLMTKRGSGTDIRPEGDTPTVIIIDDDAMVRNAMDSLFRSIGLPTLAFDSAQALLEHALPPGPSCLIMDVRLPRMSGLEIQTKLAERGDRAPIIFITGHGDIPMSVRAMKAGAVDFLAKPFRDQDIIDAVETALDRDRKRLKAETATEGAIHRAATLTRREGEVMALVVAGLMNKQIAGELGLSEITVKLHRGSMMRKMGVRTVADLVRIAEAIDRRGVQP